MSVITLGITVGTAVSAGTMWTGSVFALLAAVALALQTGRERNTQPLEARAEVATSASKHDWS